MRTIWTIISFVFGKKKYGKFDLPLYEIHIIRTNLNTQLSVTSSAKLLVLTLTYKLPLNYSLSYSLTGQMSNCSLIFLFH